MGDPVAWGAAALAVITALGVAVKQFGGPIADAWRDWRHGHRTAQVQTSQARALDAYATAQSSKVLGDTIEHLTRQGIRNQQRLQDLARGFQYERRLRKKEQAGRAKCEAATTRLRGDVQDLQRDQAVMRAQMLETIEINRDLRRALDARPPASSPTPGQTEDLRPSPR